jgi:hypothetical protein
MASNVHVVARNKIPRYNVTSIVAVRFRAVAILALVSNLGRETEVNRCFLQALISDCTIIFLSPLLYQYPLKFILLSLLTLHNFSLINQAFNKVILQSGRVKIILFYRNGCHMLKLCVRLSGTFMTARKLCGSNQWIHSTAPLSKHHYFKAKPSILCFITSDTLTKIYLSADCNVLSLQLVLYNVRLFPCVLQSIKLVCTFSKLGRTFQTFLSTSYRLNVPSVEQNDTCERIVNASFLNAVRLQNCETSYVVTTRCKKTEMCK